jgi:hypothetical protein
LAHTTRRKLFAAIGRHDADWAVGNDASFRRRPHQAAMMISSSLQWAEQPDLVQEL